MGRIHGISCCSAAERTEKEAEANIKEELVSYIMRKSLPPLFIRQGRVIFLTISDPGLWVPRQDKPIREDINEQKRFLSGIAQIT